MKNISLEETVFMENENIKIWNQLNEKANAFFSKFLNEKIIKTDNSLIKKIKDDNEFKAIMNEKNYKTKPLKNGRVSLTMYVQHQYNNLEINIKHCFSGGNYEDNTYYCVYVERALYVGETKEGKLIRLDGIRPQELIDYEEQKKLIEQFQQKKKELDDIRKNIKYVLNDFTR